MMSIPGAPHPPRPEILVLGYGSSLRSDDSVGPRAAAAIARRTRPGVRAMAAAQLTPELAESVAAARLVVFVDARRAPAGARVRARRIEAASGASALAHVSTPEGLLALAQTLFGARPRAWLVTVPGADFAVGEGLSPRARTGLDAALRTIATLVRRPATRPVGGRGAPGRAATPARTGG